MLTRASGVSEHKCDHKANWCWWGDVFDDSRILSISIGREVKRQSEEQRRREHSNEAADMQNTSAEFWMVHLFLFE